MVTEEDRKPEATSSSIDEKQVKNPSKPRHRYIAVRKCDSLKAPAIFFGWDDCSFYVDQEENECKVEYKGFDLILDAMEWVYNGAMEGSTAKEKAALLSNKSNQHQFVGGSDDDSPASTSRTASALSAPSGQLPASKPLMPAAYEQEEQDPPANIPPSDGSAAGQAAFVAQSSAAQPTSEKSTAAAKKVTTTPTRGRPRKRSAEEAALDPGAAELSVDELRELDRKKRVAEKDRLRYHRKKEEREAIDPPQPKLLAWMEQWDEKVAMLKAYKAKFHTAQIPMGKKEPEGFKGLKIWVARVREGIRGYQSDPSSCSFLDDDKVQALLELGLAPTKNYKRDPEVVWEERCEEMARYQQESGECEIPRKAAGKNLKMWIKLNRDEYAKMKKGDDTILTAQRIARLAEIGFRFTAKKPLTWEERMEQWREYRTKNEKGPNRSSKDGLGRWVTDQRSKYRQLQKGEPTNLTQEQADHLTALGFTWDLGIKLPKHRHPTQSWDETYADLLAYKVSFVHVCEAVVYSTNLKSARSFSCSISFVPQSINGHVNVPQHYPRLGHWVHSQRNDYQRFLKGTGELMTAKKIAKLTAIGFVFSAKEFRGGAGKLPRGPIQN
jgi:hypothetical protein